MEYIQGIAVVSPGLLAYWSVKKYAALVKKLSRYMYSLRTLLFTDSLYNCSGARQRNRHKMSWKYKYTRSLSTW